MLDEVLSSSTVETQQLGFRLTEHDFSDLKPASVHFVTSSCPKQDLEMEAVFLKG